MFKAPLYWKVRYLALPFFIKLPYGVMKSTEADHSDTMLLLLWTKNSKKGILGELYSMAYSSLCAAGGKRTTYGGYRSNRYANRPTKGKTTVHGWSLL